jgi:hypothetical protein
VKVDEAIAHFGIWENERGGYGFDASKVKPEEHAIALRLVSALSDRKRWSYYAMKADEYASSLFAEADRYEQEAFAIASEVKANGGRR